MLIVSLIWLLVAYLTIVGLLYSAQRQILYPGAGPSTGAWEGTEPDYRTIRLRTVDGLELKALFRPAAPGKSTILYFHGNGETVAGSRATIGPLAEQGYGALLAEFRGYAGNPGSPDEQGLYHDGEAAWRWLIDQGVSPSQVVVAGYSLGSAVASKVAADGGSAGLIMIAPFESVPRAAFQHFPWLPAHAMVKDVFATSERIARVKGPILLLHGADDRTVYPSNSLALHRARPDATLLILPDQDHLIAFQPEAANAIRSWLARNRL
ncbi:MAG: alpha/beta hydrolase [Sphingomicrobium sp.]